MSIATVCQAIAEIGNGIAGIKKAFDPPPSKLDTAQLPALYVLTGAATYDQEGFGDDYLGESRQYRVQVMVQPLGQKTPQIIEELCRPLIVAVRDAYLARPSLEGTTNVMDVRVLGDSGPAVVDEFGSQFVGFEVRLQVNEIVTRTFADGE